MANKHVLDYTEKDGLDNNLGIDERFIVNNKNKVGNCADFFLEVLKKIEVDYVFGVPGGAIEPLYSAMARSARSNGVRAVVARHETGAAFMADGYARETGGIGVCCGTSGPGATNLITGVASAYDNQIPLLVITGQPSLVNLGKYALQESSCTGVNILAMFEHCTHFNTLISHAEQFERKLILALNKAIFNRGPVHLSVPTDIFRSPYVQREEKCDFSKLLDKKSAFDFDKTNTLLELLSHGKKAVFVIGGGCVDAIDLIMQYINNLKANFIVTPEAKGLINIRNPLFCGVFGFGGHESANKIISSPDIDYIVAIGLSVGEWNTDGWSQSLLSDKLIHIDECENRLSRTSMAKMHVYGRINAIFSYLINQKALALGVDHLRSSELNFDANVERFFQENIENYNSLSKPIKPQRVMRELSQRFGPKAIFYADAGNSIFWATQYLSLMNRRLSERRVRVVTSDYSSFGRRKSFGGWLRLTTHFASMGWAISAAIGTALANKNSPVVCITGDGSFLMSSQELSTAVSEKLTVIYIILNDAAYGMVKHGQELANVERTAFKLPNTNFAKLAEALGAVGHVIETYQDFDYLDFDKICTRNGPTVLDIRIDGNEVPPIGNRVKALGGMSSISKSVH